MPRYDFECPACNETFEVQASFAEYAKHISQRDIACPRCGSKKVIRVLSPPNIVSTTSTRGQSCCPGGRCE